MFIRTRNNIVTSCFETFCFFLFLCDHWSTILFVREYLLFLRLLFSHYFFPHLKFRTSKRSVVLLLKVTKTWRRKLRRKYLTLHCSYDDKTSKSENENKYEEAFSRKKQGRVVILLTFPVEVLGSDPILGVLFFHIYVCYRCVICLCSNLTGENWQRSNVKVMDPVFTLLSGSTHTHCTL